LHHRQDGNPFSVLARVDGSTHPPLIVLVELARSISDARRTSSASAPRRRRLFLGICFLVINKMAQNTDEFYRFCVKNALVASSLAFVVGVQMRNVVATFIDTLIDPLLSVDLNNDGVPDMEQIKQWVIQIGKYKFAIGRLVVDIIKTAMTVGVVYSLVHFILKNYPLLDEGQDIKKGGGISSVV
jgi:large-conductance mechanosensitive channel